VVTALCVTLLVETGAEVFVSRAAIAVGEKVVWNNKKGTVAFVGATKFASGKWVGVILDTPEGMHDGKVMGVQYFTCAPKCGIFASESMLSAAGAAAPPPPPPAPAGGQAVPRTSGAGVHAGEKVLWNGKPGTVAFVGPTKFASGTWVGVVLDAPQGMHNGTVLGVEYFTCAPKCGIFAPESMVAVLADSPADAAFVPKPAVPASPSECAAEAIQLCVGNKVLWNGKPGTVRFVGPTKFAAGEWVGVELEQAAGMHDGTVMGKQYFTCGPRKGVFAQASMLKVTAAA